MSAGERLFSVLLVLFFSLLAGVEVGRQQVENGFEWYAVDSQALCKVVILLGVVVTAAAWSLCGKEE